MVIETFNTEPSMLAIIVTYISLEVISGVIIYLNRKRFIEAIRQVLRVPEPQPAYSEQEFDSDGEIDYDEDEDDEEEKQRLMRKYTKD